MSDQPISEDRLILLDRYANDSEAMGGLEFINMDLWIAKGGKCVN